MNNFRSTIQVFMPRPPYNSRERQRVDSKEMKRLLRGGNSIRVDPDFPYARDVQLRDVQDQPDGGLWTSSLMRTSDGRYTTDWLDWCEDNMPHWVSQDCALMSIRPEARIYTIEGVEDYHRLRDMYPYPLYERHGRQERLGHSVDWVAVSQDYDGVHHERGMSDWVRSTIWLNPEQALSFIRVCEVPVYGESGTDFLGRPKFRHTIINVPDHLEEGDVDFNDRNYFRKSYPEYFRLYRRVSRTNPHSDLMRKIESLKPSLCRAAQDVYDAWDEHEDVYFGGGICHLIADAMAESLDDHGVDALTLSQSVGEVHVFVVAYDEDAKTACLVDISPYTYERGSGYNWSKVEGVTFGPDDIYIQEIAFEESLWED